MHSQASELNNWPEAPDRDRLLAALAAVVGACHVLTDPNVTESYSRDWTGRWSGKPIAVVRPATTEQVAAVVRSCAAARIPLVPQGGNTGLVGAAVPADGEVVLSTRRLRNLGPVDTTARTVEAEAGVTLAEIQSHVRAAGLDIGIDFGARDSATIGGIIATNAGGERVMRYGTTQAQVLGIEAVLGDGSLISRMSGLPKDNVGFDLVHLLVGSEGTLGVVTRVLLRLVPHASQRAVALIGLKSIADALSIVGSLRSKLPGMEAADYFHDHGLQLVLKHSRLTAPFPKIYPVYLLVEASGSNSLEELASAMADSDQTQDAAMAESPHDRHRLWALREGHTVAISAAGVPLKLDVAVPTARLAEFEDIVVDTIKTHVPKARTVLFGHLVEGNVHVNILDVPGPDQELVTDSVLRLVAALGGSISAEHGIGRAKRQWLTLGRSQADITTMLGIKRSLDPAGILSPGRILPSSEPLHADNL
jgi:FAD/FMN-containing dehydrogenase